MFSFIVTFILFSLSFQNYFLQQATRHRVITCAGDFKHEGERFLVSLTNRGETTVFRNVSLFALREGGPIHGKIMSKLLGIPSFEIFAAHPVAQGLMVLPAGDSIVFPKDTLIIEIEILYKDLSLLYPNLKEDLQVCILAHNEEFDLGRPETYNTSLVAGTLLGKLSDLVKYAKGELDHFPGSPIGRGMYIKIFGDIGKAKVGQKFPARLLGESLMVPPLWDREIYNKLDSIDRKLSKITKSKKSGNKKD